MLSDNDFPDFKAILFPLAFHRQTMKYLNARLDWAFNASCQRRWRMIQLETSLQLSLDREGRKKKSIQNYQTTTFALLPKLLRQRTIHKIYTLSFFCAVEHHLQGGFRSHSLLQEQQQQKRLKVILLLYIILQYNLTK